MVECLRGKPGVIQRLRKLSRYSLSIGRPLGFLEDYRTGSRQRAKASGSRSSISDGELKHIKETGCWRNWCTDARHEAESEQRSSAALLTLKEDHKCGASFLSQSERDDEL
jgi:hypothetical protein